MRIASLLSSATEIVYTLGLEDGLVAISHECDHPPDALRRPRVSRARFDPAGMDSGEIDAAVRRSMQEFGSVYTVDTARLAELRPELILTQGVCEVCAVPTGSVEAVVRELPFSPQVVSLDAHTLEGIFATVRQVAEAAGVVARGQEVVAQLEARIERVRLRVAGAARPRVLALEWLDPPFAPGHWVPQMIELAGGQCLIGATGGHSVEIAWGALAELDPDVLLLLPCGYDLDQAHADAERHRTRLAAVAPRALRTGRAWLGHGAYFSRSGPRIVDGIEALAAVFHPERVANASLAGRVQPWP